MDNSSGSAQLVADWRTCLTALTFAASLFCTVHPIHIRPAGSRRKLADDRCSSQSTGSWEIFARAVRALRKARLDLSTAPPLGVLFLLATTAVTPGDVRRGLLGSDGIRPFDVLVLVFAFAYISISIDLTGLYAYVALKVVTSSKGRKDRLLFGVFFCSWLLGIVSGNDVVVLTLTPICVYFSRRIKSDPLPYLIAEFFAANNSSLVLVIGNPTNVIVALANNINFLAYTAIFILPAVTAAIAVCVALRLLFTSRLSETCLPSELSDTPTLAHPRAAFCKCFMLLSCTIVLAVTNMISDGSVEMWIVTVPFAVALLLMDLITDILRRSGNHGSSARPEKVTTVGRTQSSNELTEYAFVEKSSEFFRIGGASEANTIPELVRCRPHSTSISHVNSGAIKVAQVDDGPFYSVPDYSYRDSFAAASLQHGRPHSLSTDAIDRRNSSSSHTSEVAEATMKFPTVGTTLKRMPWSLAPFALSMSVLVEALHVQGWTSSLAKLLAPACANVWSSVFVIGMVTVLGCQLANNLPATIFLTRVIRSADFAVPLEAKRGALFALAYGSNVGANMLVHASLAGLMWMDVLRKKDCPISNWTFAKWNMAVLPAALFPGLAVLAFQLSVDTFSRILESS